MKKTGAEAPRVAFPLSEERTIPTGHSELPRYWEFLVNKMDQLIVDHCVKHGVGNIVCGWNEGFKINATMDFNVAMGGVNMGWVNNQNFVQMPLAKLKDRISQLCEENRIRFEVTEEAYTSKGSFLDGGSLPLYGYKPDGWKVSGQRAF